MSYDLYTWSHVLQYVCVCIWVYTYLCFSVFLCVYGFCIVPVRMYAHPLKRMSFLADQDPSYGTADWRERAEQQQPHPRG
jgi:fatty acid desaturase